MAKKIVVKLDEPSVEQMGLLDDVVAEYLRTILARDLS
jgi:hypothetical protein